MFFLRLTVFLCVVGFFASFSYAQSAKLQGIKKDQVGSMVDSFVERGMISQKEAEAAKKQLESMDEEQWQGLLNKAQDVVEKDPEKLKKIKQQVEKGETLTP